MHIFSHKTVQLFVRSLKAYHCRHRFQIGISNYEQKTESGILRTGRESHKVLFCLTCFFRISRHCSQNLFVFLRCKAVRKSRWFYNDILESVIDALFLTV